MSKHCAWGSANGGCTLNNLLRVSLKGLSDEFYPNGFAYSRATFSNGSNVNARWLSACSSFRRSGC